MSNKLKILLVRYHDGPNINTRLPKILNRIRGTMPPLGLLFIAAYIENYGYEVKVFDAIANNSSDQDYIDYLNEYKPDICGVTTMIENYFGACRACKIAKDYGAITVLGGPGMEIYPEEMIHKEYIDYGIVGEGEETFLKLIKSIESGKQEKVKDIQGLSYKTTDGITAGRPQIIRDLDLLPRPAYHLINTVNYSSLINDHPIMTYVMGRGCPFDCSFCFKQEMDKHIRYRSPKLVVDDMEYLVSEYKIKELMFYDDTFTLSSKQVTAICEEILCRGIKIKFEAPTRIDNLLKTDGIELLKLLKRAGCYRLRIGVESGDPGILRKMNKKIHLDDVELAFNRCRNARIKTFAYFIVGYLGENDKTIENTIEFAIKLDPDHAMFTVATPYPKTKLYEDSYHAGLIPFNYWKDYIEGKTTKRIPYLTPNAENMVKEAYWRFHFRLRYLFKRVVNIKSKQHLKNAIIGGFSLLFYENS